MTLHDSGLRASGVRSEAPARSLEPGAWSQPFLHTGDRSRLGVARDRAKRTEELATASVSVADEVRRDERSCAQDLGGDFCFENAGITVEPDDVAVLHACKR